jgi:hypothetical protein
MKPPHIVKVVIVVCVCLSACAKDQTQLQRELTRFEGRPVEAMIARLGTPTQQTDTGGEHWYVWSASERSFALGYWLGYEGDSTYEARCKVSARVKGDIVKEVRREGSLEDCEWLERI